MLHQFREKHDFDAEKVIQGIKWMIWGFFMKVVIADRLVDYVNQTFANPHLYSGLTLLAATFFFSIQIYCDFAGYSFIALGAAKVMGFDLMQNFDAPYFSKNLTEFWRRWHISLSAWFRDYVFTPLVFYFQAYQIKGIILSVMMTFLLSGLWHGAGWNYIIWGGLLGLGIVYEILSRDIRKKWAEIIPARLYNIGSTLLLFAYICFVDIFFRASNIQNALQVIKGIAAMHLNSSSIAEAILLFKGDNTSPSHALLIFAMIAILFLKDSKILSSIWYKKAYQSLVTWYFLVLLILLFGDFDVRTFLYFQF